MNWWGLSSFDIFNFGAMWQVYCGFSCWVWSVTLFVANLGHLKMGTILQSFKSQGPLLKWDDMVEGLLMECSMLDQWFLSRHQSDHFVSSVCCFCLFTLFWLWDHLHLLFQLCFLTAHCKVFRKNLTQIYLMSMTFARLRVSWLMFVGVFIKFSATTVNCDVVVNVIGTWHHW